MHHLPMNAHHRRAQAHCKVKCLYFFPAMSKCCIVPLEQEILLCLFTKWIYNFEWHKKHASKDEHYFPPIAWEKSKFFYYVCSVHCPLTKAKRIRKKK